MGSEGCQRAGDQCAADGVSMARTSETRMQRQWVRVRVRVGAASDVVERRKAVKSVEVSMMVVLVGWSREIVKVKDGLRELSIASSRRVEPGVLTQISALLPGYR